jgi:serine/threonine protein kinase
MARGASGSYEKTFRMTTDEGLDLAYQFTQFLINAHSKDIIYMDHKPEHVYWDGENIKIIDLNVSKQLSDSLDAETKKFEKTKDMQNFMMGVLYTVFTGYDFRYNVNALNKRPFADPSHPNAVKKRYENVRSQGILDFAMEETLLPELVELINSVMLNEKYISAEKFLLGLKKCASIIGWNKGEEVVSSEAAQARKLRLSGIKSLYEAQERLNDAKKLFLEANKHNPEDDEARRLYLKCCEFFKHRVLPK